MEVRLSVVQLAVAPRAVRTVAPLGEILRAVVVRSAVLLQGVAQVAVPVVVGVVVAVGTWGQQVQL